MRLIQALGLTASLAVVGCSNSDEKRFPYTEGEAQQFVQQVGEHLTADISDLSASRGTASEVFYLFSRYQLDESAAQALRQNGVLLNRDDDLADFLSYSITHYQLTNQNHQALKLVDDGSATTLQEYSIDAYQGVLYQHVGIKVRVDKPFTAIKGSMRVTLLLPSGASREVDIPVELSVDEGADA